MEMDSFDNVKQVPYQYSDIKSSSLEMDSFDNME